MTIANPSLADHSCLAPMGTSLRPVLIATSFYKAEELPAALIASLIACADEIVRTGSRLVFYNDSPGYAPLQAALTACLSTIGGAFDYTLHEPPENRGFLRTMNDAIAEAVDSRCDLLLLNSDTRLVPGALSEMIRVARLDAMTGFVNPRSNNATIATLQIGGRAPDTTEAGLLEAMQALANKLPETRYIPTAVGFCMLVRWHIIAEFGGFDEIYGAGYNEENDLVMRAARCGYRAVLANHAFVWHVGEASFAASPTSRDVWETKNRAILDQRYPEYARTTAAFYHAPETLAERLMVCLLPDREGRLDLAFDFSSFRADFNGTFQAGGQLLRVADQVWGARFRTFVICEQDVYDFHGYAELGIPRSDPHSGRAFGVVFRIGQPYDWNSIERLATSGAVIGLYMLDTISIDCPQLGSPALHHMWQVALDQSDFIVVQSHHTQKQLSAKFRIPGSTPYVMAQHSLDLRDYELGQVSQAIEQHQHGRILVVGNHFAHKYVAPTANALTAAFAEREIVVLGMQSSGAVPASFDPPDRLRAAPNLLTYKSGCLAQSMIDELYLATDVVVFPSHAEGFGFPLLIALANRKPVFVRRLPVFEELWEAFDRNENLYFYDTTAELMRRLQTLPVWRDGPVTAAQGCDAAWSAGIIIAGIEAALQRADYQRVVARLRLVQTVGLNGPKDHSGRQAETFSEAAARLIGERTENLARRMFQFRGVLRATRAVVRGARALRRIGRLGQ